MNGIRTASAATVLATLALIAQVTAATPAAADPPGMGPMLQPHNAAVHFLDMAGALGLDDAQVAKLRRLRDAWIANNSTNEARLEAAEIDLQALLFARSVDRRAIEDEVAQIGPMESQLRLAFTQQLLEIDQMLTDPQKARLREIRRRHPVV
jgi:Spy/CpxP family protein refolding chaperone